MNSTPPVITQAETTARALQLWQLAGNPVGRDLEFWLAAEGEIKQERGEIAEAVAAARPARP
jgi:hypothetical protein